MKNPTSRTANRTIDVIFVHPKQRSYVIWHDGAFYQLTRMALSVRAWERKVAYTGSLDEIFVAKESCEQGEIDNVLQEIGLTTVKLPSELHSITANKFLAWWTVNRYSFWHAKDVKDVSDKDVQNQPEPTAEQKPQQKIQQKIQQEAETEPQVSASTTQQSAMDKKAGKNSDVMDNAVQTNQVNQASQANQTLTEQAQMQAPPKPTHKPHKPLEQLSGDDIFDALLDDLVDEVNHLK